MPDDLLIATRQALHALGEHILAAARYRSEGRIGLAVVTGGIATPAFGPGATVIAIIDGELVVREAGADRRAPLTTLRAAGEFVGITPGAPRDVYLPNTPCELDAPLAVDRSTLIRLTDWYALVDASLRAFTPEPPTLWPEHFDCAVRVDEVNYGGLGGDAGLEVPYLYVGPDPALLPDEPDAYWNQPYGASATWNEISTTADAARFLTRGRDLLTGVIR